MITERRRHVLTPPAAAFPRQLALKPEDSLVANKETFYIHTGSLDGAGRSTQPIHNSARGRKHVRGMDN